MEKRTQTNDIYTYMKTHKRGITSKQAFELFGATRLSGIIHQMRARGINIVSENIVVKNRYGGKSMISCYKLMD